MGITVGGAPTTEGELPNTWEFGDYTITLDYDRTTGGGVSMKVDMVPEPGTWALMIGGVGVLALLRRRKA